jgi:hypothetical protein
VGARDRPRRRERRSELLVRGEHDGLVRAGSRAAARRARVPRRLVLPALRREEQRRPLYTRLVAEGFPAGYAATDDAAAHFVGTTFERAITQRDDARVYRVERSDDGSVLETPL